MKRVGPDLPCPFCPGYYFTVGDGETFSDSLNTAIGHTVPVCETFRDNEGHDFFAAVTAKRDAAGAGN
jgi:hypothetical protein